MFYTLYIPLKWYKLFHTHARCTPTGHPLQKIPLILEKQRSAPSPRCFSVEPTVIPSSLLYHCSVPAADADTFLWSPCLPEYDAPICCDPIPSWPGSLKPDGSASGDPSHLLVSSKEQKILGLSNHRTGDYSFPINAANTSSYFHLILICSASYTRTCSTKTRSSSLVSVFASLY